MTRNIPSSDKQRGSKVAISLREMSLPLRRKWAFSSFRMPA